MKILFLTELFPVPKNSGSKIISYELLHALSNNCEIHFASFFDSSTKHVDTISIKKMCKSFYIESKALVFRKHIMRLSANFIFNLFNTLPHRITKFSSQKMKNNVENMLMTNDIDIIIVCHDTLMQYVPDWFQKKIIYVPMDVMSSLYHQFFQNEKNILKKLFYLYESKRILKYEYLIIQKATHIWSISHDDIKTILKCGVDRKKVAFFPIPIKFRYSYKNLKVKEHANILFVGVLSWKPNYDGLEWFLIHIFPQILISKPNCSLTIAGSGASVYKNKYKNNNLLFEDTFSYDSNKLRQIYSNTSVCIVPVLSGSGVRMKLLEALSHGIPVVTTSIGAKGISLKHAIHAFIADDPNLFVTYILRLLNDREVSINMSLNGFDFIKKNYSQLQSQKFIRKHLLNK
jgi:polysaccharide biosynthesis protein PslH